LLAAPLLLFAGVSLAIGLLSAHAGEGRAGRPP
jgi:hypothetical protein